MRFFDIPKPSLDSTRQMFIELESDERALKLTWELVFIEMRMD
jgi:hypothetical protein